ncbi:MAG: helix-turn-helix domain-containing protein [Acidimicrobiia bacterium]
MPGNSVPLPTSVAGGLLRLARMEAGISQRELASRAGVPQSMIAAYERGRREPTLPTLLRLLEAAGFELRLHLTPTDDHDASLAWQGAQLPPGEQRRRQEAEEEFVRTAAERLA